MNAERYLNRELSWIEFNARVLSEALETDNPLLERLKFLSIVASNFDEFFMVRVASVKAAIRTGDQSETSGMSSAELLAAISRQVREIVAAQYKCLAQVLAALDQKGLSLARSRDWSQSERRWLESWFLDSVLPALTPLRVESVAGGDALDARNAFPSTGNLRLHAAFLLESGKEGQGEEAAIGLQLDEGATGPFLAIAQVPPNLDRFVRLPSSGPRVRIALLDEVVEAFGARLFPGLKVVDTLLFKVTRDADFGVDEDRDEDFIAAMEEVLAGRQNSWPVRLTHSGSSARIAAMLRDGLGLVEEDVYALPGPMDLRSLMDLATADWLGAEASAKLRDEAWHPVRDPDLPEGTSIWDRIRSGDRLLHCPYESFDPVIRFLDEAADDPSVIAIKMTLYRTSGNSPIVRALTRAARGGKQVMVLVELKARFDEEKNITWATRLEQAGAIVSYGIARLKVHAKAALVVRRERDGSIRRYLHLATGNYNDRTARLYADLSLFTADEALCREAGIFFNMVTGYSSVQGLRRLAIAPIDLKARLLGMIDREAQRSSPESPGLIMAKVNALADTDVIEALYRASAAGCRILLNVRGICALVPGQPGLSENITVVSVVGRYLEHARAFCFRNGGSEELYLSSADWLPRNLEKRIELMFPIQDEAVRAEIREILSSYFRDTVKAHRLLPEGRWERIAAATGEKPFSAQASFHEAVLRKRALAEAPAEELQVRRRPT